MDKMLGLGYMNDPTSELNAMLQLQIQLLEDRVEALTQLADLLTQAVVFQLGILDPALSSDLIAQHRRVSQV